MHCVTSLPLSPTCPNVTLAYHIALERTYTNGWYSLQYTDALLPLVCVLVFIQTCPTVTHFALLSPHTPLALLSALSHQYTNYTCSTRIILHQLPYYHYFALHTTLCNISPSTHYGYHSINTTVTTNTAWSSCHVCFTRWCKLQPSTTLRCMLEQPLTSVNRMESLPYCALMSHTHHRYTTVTITCHNHHYTHITRVLHGQVAMYVSQGGANFI
jgi:hypothetical protein